MKQMLQTILPTNENNINARLSKLFIRKIQYFAGRVDRMTNMNLVVIDAFDINDAWFRCVQKCVEVGYEYVITRGSYAGQKRKEFDFVTGVITNPGNRPLNIIIPEGSSLPAPNDSRYIETYFAEYLGSDTKKPNEDYTYGERLNNPKIRGMDEILSNDITALGISEEKESAFKERLKEITLGISPFKEVVKMYIHQGFGTNQATMEIAMPSDVLLKDPPCLRLIDTRIRYGKLHFAVYFRSWDLVGGFPSNLGGIQLLKELMLQEINDGLEAAGKEERVEDGEIIFSSKGLHIYDHQWEYAKLRLRIPL